MCDRSLGIPRGCRMMERIDWRQTFIFESMKHEHPVV